MIIGLMGNSGPSLHVPWRLIQTQKVPFGICMRHTSNSGHDKTATVCEELVLIQGLKSPDELIELHVKRRRKTTTTYRPVV